MPEFRADARNETRQGDRQHGAMKKLITVAVFAVLALGCGGSEGGTGGGVGAEVDALCRAYCGNDQGGPDCGPDGNETI